MTDQRLLGSDISASAELLELAQEAGGVGIFEWQVPDGIVQLSSKFLSLYGLDEFDGRFDTWLDCIFREDRPRVFHMIQSTFAEGRREMQAEFRVARADGELKWIEARYLIFYEDGAPSRVVGVNVDITERKQAIVQLRSFTETLEDAVRERHRIAEALREESETLETLNRAGSALAAELDLQRIVQSVTDAGVALTGANFGAFFYNVLDEEGASYMLYTLSGVDRAAFENFPMPRATAVFGPTFDGKGIIRSRDIRRDPRYGKNAPHNGMPEGHLPVRSYLAVPVVSRSGEVIGGMFFGHPEPDVFTERSERVMVGIAAQAAIAIDNARLFQAVQRANQTLEQRVEERTAELEQVNEALRQAQKMEAIGQLTGGIAHDFNNLLTIVLGGLELIGRQTPALGDTPAALRIERARAMALQGVQRAVAVTSRLLAFSRQQPLAPRPLDLNRLVSGAGTFLARSIGETIELETVLGAGLWCSEVDPNELENALLNLALNARDAMPDGGKLTIETANCFLDEDYVAAIPEPVEAGQYVMLAVTDTGLGMDRHTRERVFEPFFTTKEVGKGTGLGLSQVYGFVRQSAGHIRVYSEPGEGTTVKIYLPRLLGAEVDPNELQRNVGDFGAIGTETVLVVEDDDALRAYTTETLRELGYRVLEAPDGPAALEIIEQAEGIDLLFTDVVMPRGLNGRQLADKARELRPELKVLYTTGYTRNAIVHHGRLDTDVNLISKPFSLQQLGRKIRDVLDASISGPR
jgi:PAS domain S-box-containing protein